MSKLPADWTVAKLGDVLQLKYGKSLPAKARVDGDVPVFGSNGAVGTHNRALAKGPVIVVGRKGSVGEVNYSESACWPIDTTYFVDEFREHEPRFWYHTLRYLNLGSLDRATAIPGLNREDAYDLNVPVPPPQEQKRIADKLDRLLAAVDTCKARLDAIPDILKRFRRSVLAAAVSGELTEEWRMRALSGQKMASTAGGPHPLPSNWTWTSPDEIRSEDKHSLAIGPFGSNLKVSDYRASGVPLIFVREIRARQFGGGNTKYVSQTKAEELSAHRVCAGDLLITKMGDPPGDTVIYPQGSPDAIITADCIRIKVDETKADPAYVSIALESPPTRLRLQEITAGVAQQKLSLARFRTFPLPLPSLPEQREIVRRVSILFRHQGRLSDRNQSACRAIDLVIRRLLEEACSGRWS